MIRIRVFDREFNLLYEGAVAGSPAVEVGRLARLMPWGPRMRRWIAEAVAS